MVHQKRVYNLQLDNSQKAIELHCKEIASDIKPNNFFQKFLNLFTKRNLFLGIYLYGSVGSGKTILMRRFFDNLEVSKQFIHFQKFMYEIHQKTHFLRSHGCNSVIETLSSDLSKKYRVICLDEFEIKDITDAMIIMRLFKSLGKNGVFIFLTTNVAPKNLYEAGLQRNSFLPFISYVEGNFSVLHLESKIDYRYKIISKIKNRILFPINRENKLKFEKIKYNICNVNELSEVVIELFGRKVIFKTAHQDILFTDFKELFERDLGYADYVNICKYFSVIVVSSVRNINEYESGLITRFINFIDNAYFEKISLFMELESSIEKIYEKGVKIQEFERTISRLNEMNNITS